MSKIAYIRTSDIVDLENRLAMERAYTCLRMAERSVLKQDTEGKLSHLQIVNDVVFKVYLDDAAWYRFKLEWNQEGRLPEWIEEYDLGMPDCDLKAGFIEEISAAKTRKG